MLSYLHEYHAGNHADILKHFTEIFVINSLNKKEKPYTFFDTHSGSGLYSLQDERSIKTREAENGIIKLLSSDWEKEFSSDSTFYKYLSTVKSYFQEGKYPGSPEIEKTFLRKQDFLVLSELHPQEFENLKKNIIQKENNPSIHIHKRNGWELLNSLTPPATKRGAVLIDPSYEETKDYEDAANTIIKVFQKWTNGIIMLWYPLLLHRENDIMCMKEKITAFAKKLNPNIEISDLQLCINQKDSHIEMELSEYLKIKNRDDKQTDKKNPPRLYGSGMLILNSPWKLSEEAEKVISFCQKNLQFSQINA